MGGIDGVSGGEVGGGEGGKGEGGAVKNGNGKGKSKARPRNLFRNASNRTPTARARFLLRTCLLKALELEDEVGSEAELDR